MKKRIIIETAVFITLVLGIVIYAYAGRITHTDYTGDLIDKIESNQNAIGDSADVNGEIANNKENLPDNGVTYYVAEMWESLITDISGILEEEYVKSPYIIRCTVLESMEPSYNDMRVHVRVNKVYEGDDINVGEDIYITRGHPMIGFNSQGKNVFLELGFHNFMQKGEEYLVFLEEKINLNEDKYGNVFAMEGFSFPPFFLCEEDRDCVFVPITGDTSYVEYAAVINNEFFCENEKALEIIRGMKHRMLEKYN